MSPFTSIYSRLALAFLLIFTSGPFALTPINVAYAQETTSADEPEKNIDQEIEELRKAFLNPDTNSSALDPFQLTAQVVVDDRRSNVDALIEDTTALDYKQRVEHFTNEIAELEDLKTQAQAKLDLENSKTPTDNNKTSELEGILLDIESRQKIAHIELKDLEAFDPAKGTPLPIDHMIEKDLRVRHYYGRNLTVKLNYRDGHTHNVRQRDFTESLSPDSDFANPVERSAKFEITTPKGVVLHRFLKPIESLFFYGQYLVYVESRSYDSDRGVQEVKFVDLNYFKVNIGNAPLPVYTLPVKTDRRPSGYSVQNGYLEIGDQKISHPQIDILSKTQRLVFNVNAALVDPSTYENARPLIDDIGTFFGASMEGQDSLFQEQMAKAFESENLIAQSSQRLNNAVADQGATRELIAEALKDKKITNAEYKKIKTALDAGDHVSTSNTALHVSKKLMTRINLLVRFLTNPRPEGAPKIFNALVIAATSGQEDRSKILEFTKNSFGYKLAKYGVAAGGTLLAAATVSPFVSDQLSQSLDLVSAVHQHYIGYLEHIDYGKNYVELSKDAVITSVSGWTYVIESYFADGKWSKFLYGLGSVLLIPVKLFSSVHFSVNTIKMYKQTRDLRADLSAEQRQGFIKSFISAAAAESKAYWDTRSEAEKGVSGSDVSEMSDEDLKLLDATLSRLRNKSADTAAVYRDLGLVKARPLKRFAVKFSETVKVHKISSYAKGVKNNLSEMRQRLNSKLGLELTEGSFFKGLADTFFSYSALTSTFKTNSNIWNSLYVARSFAFSPSKWLMFVIYPNFFARAISGPNRKQLFPTHYNGGLESWVQKLRRLPLPEFAKKPFGQYFLSKEALANLKSFEDVISNAETAMMEMSFKKAQIALLERLDDPDKYLSLFDSTADVHPITQQSTVTTGIQSLHDPKIKTLSRKDRLFFRAYYTRTFDTAMQSFITYTLGVEEQTHINPKDYAKAFARELKANRDYLERDANPENADIVKLIDDGDIELMKNWSQQANKEVEATVDFDEIKKWSNSVVDGGESFLTKLDIQYRHKLLGSIHPNNSQITRYLTAKEKVQDPRAMARATREEVTSLVSSIPIGIASTLALYAGVQTGVLQPFDANGMDSETHFRYMSRYLFYSGFIPGLIIGLMANTWMKVQTDARIDALGGFDKAIMFSDSKKGFWRYYVKNFFKHPANKWKSNHVFMLKLIWSNIPAAAVTILVSQAYGLGRIDPGIVLSGYVMIFASVLIGLNTKTDQAFELATTWVFDKVPRRFRAHPDAQKYLEGQVQKRRIYFGWFDNLWGVIVQENIAGDMLTLKDNAKMGTRSFFRLLFGGDTPTEILVNFADRLKTSLASVPGVESALETFKKWISNGFEAFERYPDRLPEMADRLTENPDLPKSFVGEFLGKLGGMIVSVGTFAGTPYVVSDQLERREERRIQREGEAAKNKPGAMSCGSFL